MKRAVLILSVAGLVAMQTWIVMTESRLSSTDVFLFKDAGVNFATSGNFVVANLPHMSPDRESLYAYYPPVFPFAFGLWTRLVGVGLKQSILFDCLLRTLRTLLLLVVVMRGVRLRFRDLSTGQTFVVGVSLILLSLLSSDGDRPDELGIVLGLASWLAFGANSPYAGFFLGLCGATSPTAGVFFGAGIFLNWWREKLAFPKLVSVGVLSGLVFVLCILPVYFSDPLAFSRFSSQVPLSTFPFLKGGGSLLQIWRDQWAVTLRYVYAAAALVGVSLIFRIRNLSTIHWLALAFIPFSAMVWTLQPYYLWFSCTVLGGVIVGRALEPRGLRVAVAFWLALSPLIFQDIKNHWNTWERTAAQSSETVRREVLARVLPHERIAVTPDQYFTFKNHRTVANVYYVCPRLETYDYVYVTRMVSARRDTSLAIPCPTKASCFSPVLDLASRDIFTLLGYETPYFVRGSGGILFKNTGCPGSPSLAKLP